MKSKTRAEAAAIEAWEEGGAVGKVGQTPVGEYTFLKYRTGDQFKHLGVYVYPLQVTRLDDDYKEKAERRRQWFSQAEAARVVRERALRRIIRDFRP